jgi:cytochrome c-type biogenesis protein CcmE
MNPSFYKPEKILTQHIFGMVDKGERNEQRLTVGGLARLKAVERDHEIKSAFDVPSNKRKQDTSV